MNHLRIFHLEDIIENRVGGNYISYLDQFFAKRQAQEWSASWDELVLADKSAGAAHVFVTLHATYYRKRRFFSMIDVARLREFRPNVVITLIDDAHESWARVQARERKRPQGTVLTLKDMFLWRTVETMVGDFVVQGTKIPHYVVAVKHPSEMFRRLIFETDRRRVYASFPISSTRDDPESRGLVDGFRMALHENMTVFDPLTIDERVIRTKVDQDESDDPITINWDDRWPTGFPESLESMAPPVDDLYPIEIAMSEARGVSEDIDRQIEARDYRSIDQAQAIGAFRPSFRKQAFSRGMFAELLYGTQTAGIPVHVVWHEDEDGAYGDSPFSSVGTRHSEVGDVVSALTT